MQFLTQLMVLTAMPNVWKENSFMLQSMWMTVKIITWSAGFAALNPLLLHRKFLRGREILPCRKSSRKKMENYPYPSVSYEIADQIQKMTGREVRVTVPGHTQRGGGPNAYDRVFASRVGAEAGKLILRKEFGYMIGYKDREMVKVPLKEVAGKLKTVDPNASIIKEAKLLGISFGD